MEEYEELPDEVISQRHWSEEELRARGYEYYERKKEVTMARELAGMEAPKTIITSQGDSLIAQAGYMICYRPGSVVRPSLDQYEQWPVEPSIFQKTYKPWDEPEWKPSPTEKHLMELGCQPYYKAVGAWAKKMKVDVFVQGLEHTEPVRVETGSYVLIGAKGEPYSMGETTLHERYVSPPRRFMNWLRRKLRFYWSRIVS